MTASSYQNSAPGGLGTDESQAQVIVHRSIDDYQDANSNNQKSRILRLSLGVALALFLMFMGSPPAANGALRGSSDVALLQAAQADATGGGVPSTADMPQPDYNGEGKYDWQKCMDSNDPDCWKNEGERIGGYWHNFGLRMKSFWLSFRQKIHDFFMGKEAAADDTAADVRFLKKED